MKTNILFNGKVHDNNFTFVRWFAAGLVLYGHSFVFLGLPEPVFMQWITLGPLGVFIFFALSGYLVSQSWESDPHFFRFLTRRALRIFPGLFVCIIISVFLLGPLVTKLTWREYFSHPQFFGYFLNLILNINYSLPGVFEQNKYPHAVNGSLWSLPVEFFMYFFLAVWSIVKASRTSYFVCVLLFLCLALQWAMQKKDMLVFYNTDMRQVVICGVYFWMGAIFQKIKNYNFFTTSNLILVIIFWACTSSNKDLFGVVAYFCIPFVFLTFGISSHPMLVKMNNWDFSYGIYIYAFPVQQTVAHFFPGMQLIEYIALVSVITILLGAASWFLVEKPALKLKPRVISINNQNNKDIIL